jgi:hypothetical protein
MIKAAKQFTRMLRRRLPRTSTAVGLLLLLSLGVLEPMLCIIHCEMATLQAATHAGHASSAGYLCAFQQPMQAHMRADHAVVTSAGLPSHLHAPSASDRGAPAPNVAQPQPFHEMALVGVVLLLVVSVLWRARCMPLHVPPQRFLKPPLHPPTAPLRWNMA